MGEDSDHYPLERLLHAADMALEQDYNHRAALQFAMSKSVSGGALLGVVGLFLLKDDSVSIPLLMDESHEVRAMAAWTLIQNGREKRGCRRCGC